MEGELIGINGRGSFDKRGRVNSGVGYAISINQIKNFLGQLGAGLDTDHASLGAERGDGDGEVGRRQDPGPRRSSRIPTSLAAASTSVTRWCRSPAGRSPAPTSTRTCSASSREAGGCRWSIAARTKKKEILVRLMGIQRKELATTPCRRTTRTTPSSRPRCRTSRRRRSRDRQEAAGDRSGREVLRGEGGLRQLLVQRHERERLLAEFVKAGDFREADRRRGRSRGRFASRSSAPRIRSSSI